MKIRTGFVSNSSSSSYVIALKRSLEDYFYEARKKIMEFFFVNPQSTFFPIAKEIADLFLVDLKHYDTIKEAEEDYGLRTEALEKFNKREDKDEFKHVYVGSFSTGECDLEEFTMSHITVDIDNDDMIMYFDGMF